MKNLFRLVAMLIMVSSSCDKKEIASSTAPTAPTSPATSLIKSDPAASFKEFAGRFVATANKTYSRALDPMPPRIDVRKTDSLINPVLGILDLSYKMPSDGKGSIAYSVKMSTFTFAIENDKWALQSVKGETVSYHADGQVVEGELKLNDDDPLDRAIKAANQSSIPEEGQAKQIAEDVQK